MREASEATNGFLESPYQRLACSLKDKDSDDVTRLYLLALLMSKLLLTDCNQWRI